MARKDTEAAKKEGNQTAPTVKSTQAKVDSDSASAEEAKPSTTRRSDAARWTFFSNHAHVLICLYQDSELVLRDIALRVGITERAVQSIIQDLDDAGFVTRERVGRRNHYQVIRNKHLRHPIEEHCTVDMLFDVILKSS